MSGVVGIDGRAGVALTQSRLCHLRQENQPFLETVDTIELLEDFEAVFFHSLQKLEIDGPHPFRSNHRLAVFVG
jgi:hypothetical protein